MAQNNNQEIESQSVAKSRRRGSVEQVRKQQKRDLMTFSTPDVLVTLLVGWESVRFTVSKNIACYHSPVFHAAFNGSYVESTSLEYRMAHVDEPTARLLLQYLYYNALSLVQFDDRCDTHDQLSTEEQHALTVQDNDLVCLWVLADELGMPQLQNEVITQFHAIQEKLNCIPAAPINLIYDITSMESQLRRYIVTFAPETSTLPILLRCRKISAKNSCWILRFCSSKAFKGRSQKSWRYQNILFYLKGHECLGRGQDLRSSFLILKGRRTKVYGCNEWREGYEVSGVLKGQLVYVERFGSCFFDR